jgi:hypothetical protein
MSSSSSSSDDAKVAEDPKQWVLGTTYEIKSLVGVIDTYIQTREPQYINMYTRKSVAHDKEWRYVCHYTHIADAKEDTLIYEQHGMEVMTCIGPMHWKDERYDVAWQIKDIIGYLCEKHAIKHISTYIHSHSHVCLYDRSSECTSRGPPILSRQSESLVHLCRVLNLPLPSVAWHVL